MKLEDLKVNTHLMPEDGPITSSIKVLEINDKGASFQRIHYVHNGEKFFLTKQAVETSHWMIVPCNTQLCLL